MPALGRVGWPPGSRRPGGLSIARGRCDTADWAVPDLPRCESPPHRHRAVTLADRAYQPAQGVRRPAGGDRTDPVVRLPERARIRENDLAPRHGAPGGGNPDLVADDAAPGDHDRMNQRIKANRGMPRGRTIIVGQGADGCGYGCRLGYPARTVAASPGHARPPSVPRETF